MRHLTNQELNERFKRMSRELSSLPDKSEIDHKNRWNLYVRLRNISMVISQRQRRMQEIQDIRRRNIGSYDKLLTTPVSGKTMFWVIVGYIVLGIALIVTMILK